MIESNVYNGGIAIGANSQATGSGGSIHNHAPAPAGQAIAIRDEDLEPVLIQLARLQAALHLSSSELAEHIGAEVAALSRDVGKTRRADPSRVSSLLSKIKHGAAVTKSVAEAVAAVSDLLGLS